MPVVHVCSTGRKGGELASAVHAYTKTGDPYVRSLVQHILSLVSHPVLSFLYRWIYDGELEDTYHEVRNAILASHLARGGAGGMGSRTTVSPSLNDVYLSRGLKAMYC